MLKRSAEIESIITIRYTTGKAGKLIISMEDGSSYHIGFTAYRTMIGWLMHPDFAGKPLLFLGSVENDPFMDWGKLMTKGSLWVQAGGAEHWDLLSTIYGR